MHQRSSALARRTNEAQPTAVLGTLGMITLLMLMWFGLVL
jgi:hypothetical protein